MIMVKYRNRVHMFACICVWQESCYVAQTVLDFVILLPQPLDYKFWDYKQDLLNSKNTEKITEGRCCWLLYFSFLFAKLTLFSWIMGTLRSSEMKPAEDRRGV